jgi:hypothetical protein
MTIDYTKLSNGAGSDSAAHEPTDPKVTTAVPGPVTNSTQESLNAFFDARAVQLIVDYEKSQGN